MPERTTTETFGVPTIGADPSPTVLLVHNWRDLNYIGRGDLAFLGSRGPAVNRLVWNDFLPPSLSAAEDARRASCRCAFFRPGSDTCVVAALSLPSLPSIPVRHFELHTLRRPFPPLGAPQSPSPLLPRLSPCASSDTYFRARPRQGASGVDSSLHTHLYPALHFF